MRTRSHFACVAAAALVVAASRDAAAQECASTPMPADPPGVRTQARIEKIGRRYRATLDIETARSRGERVLEAESCEALARSTAVVVAMAAAPEREDEEADAPPKTEAPKAAAPAPPPAPAAPVDRDEAPRKEPDSSIGIVRVEGAADSALLPSFAFGGGLALGVRATERLRFEARAAMFAGQEERAFEDRGARFSLFSAGARACLALTRAIEIAPCLGLDVSAISAEGFGARVVADRTVFVVAPEALVAVRLPLAGPVALTAGAGVLAPLSRESFVITGRGAVHEVPALAARAFVGPEVRF